MTATEARVLGYVHGAKVEYLGSLRTIQSGRIKELGNSLITMCKSPILLYKNGEWIAKLLPKTKK